MRRLLALFLSSLLLWSVVAITNHYLAPWHVFLFVGGLYVTHGALHLPWRTGFSIALLAGLLCDAGADTRFGLHAVLFGLANGLIFHLRGQVDRDSHAVQIGIAAITNAGLFLGLTLCQTAVWPVLGSIWLRLLGDLFWSQILLVLIASWFFALQRRAIALADPWLAVLERQESE